MKYFIFLLYVIAKYCMEQKTVQDIFVLKKVAEICRGFLHQQLKYLGQQ
jgi:hypothetical protein